NNKYKTKLCKNFARGGTGFCPYGLRCEFVHPTDKE
nr:Chain X, Zinc finger protein mex-5 [Caenorhabditis elegans]